jgi:hypothetical protein
MNKKIKIYELQKKLRNKSRERRERHGAYEGLLGRQESGLCSVTELHRSMGEECGVSAKLDRLSQSLAVDICRI